MKHVKRKCGSYNPLLVLSLMVSSGLDATNSPAAESYAISPSQQVTIDEHGTCKKVTNNRSSSIFVPTKSAAEWLAFRTNASLVTFADCLCTPGSQVFASGDNQNFVVPSNCTSITVKAWGAGGDFGDSDGAGGNGGGGGYAGATLTVTPGETLKVRVGYPLGGSPGSSYGFGGTGGGSSSILRGTTVLLEAGGGGGASSSSSGDPGGGTRTCASPGNQTGESTNPTWECGGGGAGYCRGSAAGCAGQGGSSYVPAGGTELAGSGATPGNASDPDRGTAGNGSVWTGQSGVPSGTPVGPGMVKISW